MPSAKPKAEIAVIGGAGHVGLPLAITFACKGKRTLAYDVNAKALARIGEGKMPFIDRGAEPLLRQALKKGQLLLSSDPEDLRGVPVLIVTIGTPVDEFMNPRLGDITKCLDGLLPRLSDDQLLILRSTVSPGVTDWADQYLKAKGKKTLVAFCPERVTQGYAMEELKSLPQIVSGTSPEAEKRAADVFALCAAEIVFLKPMEAEFSKLFVNTYRYVLFAIANQFYTLVDQAGLDYYKILRAMKHNYNRARDIPGAGFSAGPCLFKDTVQLAAFSGNNFPLGQAAMVVNEGLPYYVAQKMAAQHDLRGKRVGILGMAFKADSDDSRSSLSYKLKKLLKARCKEVLTTDPFVQDDADLRPLDEVLRKCDILVIGAPHTAYKTLDAKGKPVYDVWDCVPQAGRKAEKAARAK